MLSEKENDSAVETVSASEKTKAERVRRKSLGIYYTPPEAAMILAHWAIRHPNETLLEPSFGGCAMLCAAVSVFKSLGNDFPSRQLFGYDVDNAAFDYLAAVGIENEENHFIQQDFLCSKAGALRVDAVLANPPFVSYHSQSETQRKLTEKLRQQYMPMLPRLASLWAFFILHSMSFLRPGGRMAFVLPNAIGNADYAKPLLSFLQSRFGKVELIHVSERLFIQVGADERISLLLLSDFSPSGIAAPAAVVSRHIFRVNEFLNNGPTVDPGRSNELGDVRRRATLALAQLGTKVFTELGASASVQIGEVVGDIDFFVRPRAVWKRHDISTKYLFPLLTRAAQVSGIYVQEQERQLEIWAIPQLLIPPERRHPKAIETYLAEYSEPRIANNKTFGKRKIWYRCSYEVSADAFIGSMNHDFPRIIGNDGAISCSNAFYKISVISDKNLAAWLPLLAVTTPLRLSAELLGRVRGSGGIKLEPSDVKKLCIPNKLPTLPKKEFDETRKQIDALIRKGEIDAAGQIADSIIFLKSDLIDPQTMSKLRMMRISLTSRRLSKSR